MDLPEGEHQFKFNVDGQWLHDPTVVSVDNGKQHETSATFAQL